MKGKNMEKNNITLLGMPGVGKSTIGVILAKILGYKFIDTDLIIQEQEGRLLKTIIAEDGIESFMALENKTIANLTAEKAVIATGGSAVYGAEAMARLGQIGAVVYLQLDLKTLSQRLKNIKNRGVVFKEGQNLTDIFQERVPLYEKYADLIINEDHKGPEETIEVILASLNKTT